MLLTGSSLSLARISDNVIAEDNEEKRGMKENEKGNLDFVLISVSTRC